MFITLTPPPLKGSIQDFQRIDYPLKFNITVLEFLLVYIPQYYFRDWLEMEDGVTTHFPQITKFPSHCLTLNQFSLGKTLEGHLRDSVC